MSSLKMTDKQFKQFKDWLSTKSKEIQEVGNKYPPVAYWIKEGAPYSISVPGTRVFLIGYSEDGTVIIAIHSSDKKDEAIEHEKKLGIKYGKTEKFTNHVNKSSVQCKINPIWLEPIKGLVPFFKEVKNQAFNKDEINLFNSSLN